MSNEPADDAWASGALPSSAPPGAPDAVEAVLARGHVWLRFPDDLEAAFQADTLAPRRRLLMFCGVLGIVSIYFGTLNIAALNPDIVGIALAVARANVGAGGLGLLLLFIIPPRWRRAWQAEAVTALMAIGTCAGVINGCLFSHADTTFTHSAVIVSVVMYTCIAARQRFRWSLACAIAPFVAYVALVKGTTPQQELIVAANIRLMALSFVFALMANYTFEHRERRTWLLRRLEAQRREALIETSERLRQQSTQDPLTALHNRRRFDEELGQAWAEAARTQQPVAMLMADVDFFKRYNDTYGHPAGDACLVRVSQVLADVVRQHGGIAARLGGEEFGVLLPGATLAQAMAAGTALCEGVRAANIEHKGSTVAPHVTVSVGVAQAWPLATIESASLLKQADEALYRAKEGGRDRTVAAAAAPRDTTLSAVSSVSLPQSEQTPVSDLPEAAFLRTLNGRFRWLRFPAEQETAYQRDRAAQRRSHLMLMSVLGLAIYQLYILGSRAMYPDVQAHAMPVQLGLSAIFLIVAAVGHRLDNLSLWSREAFFSFGTSAMAVVTLWILSQSHHLSALSFAVSLALIPMFSGAGAQQPFWFASAPALTTCVAAAWLLAPRTGPQALVFHDGLLMIVNNSVFALILAYTLEHGARKAWLLDHIERLQGRSLMAATRQLHELSILDPLTGLCNRRQFDADFQRLWDEGVREARPLAMLIVDIDFFKRYNDGYGHPEGDRCLKLVAATIKGVAQAAHAMAARLGGEEFGVLLPAGDPPRIVALGERVCAAVREAHIAHAYSEVPGQQVVTVSVGAASLLPAQGGNRRALIAMADDALYQAKHLGRNRVAALRVPGASG